MKERKVQPKGKGFFYTHDRAFKLNLLYEGRLSSAEFGILVVFEDGRYSQDFMDDMIVEVLSMLLRHEEQGTTCDIDELADFLSDTFNKGSKAMGITDEDGPLYVHINCDNMNIMLYDANMYGVGPDSYVILLLRTFYDTD